MLNTVIFNFLFKNFITLWRHLAKTQILSFIHIVQIDLSITQWPRFYCATLYLASSMNMKWLSVNSHTSFQSTINCSKLVNL